jgi:hypothetical protein
MTLNTHDTIHSERTMKCPILKLKIESKLAELRSHYGCRYALISFSDSQYSHIPCVVSYDVMSRELFPPKLAHFQGTSFCQTTLDRPIPVIISILSESAFKSNNLVTGHPGLTSFVGVPLIIDDVNVGAMCMFWTIRNCSNDSRDYEKAEAASQNISSLLKDASPKNDTVL